MPPPVGWQWDRTREVNPYDLSDAAIAAVGLPGWLLNDPVAKSLDPARLNALFRNFLAQHPEQGWRYYQAAAQLGETPRFQPQGPSPDLPVVLPPPAAPPPQPRVVLPPPATPKVVLPPPAASTASAPAPATVPGPPQPHVPAPPSPPIPAAPPPPTPQTYAMPPPQQPGRQPPQTQTAGSNYYGQTPGGAPFPSFGMPPVQKVQQRDNPWAPGNYRSPWLG